MKIKVIGLNKKGFTMVELMVVMAIFLIIGAALTTMINVGDDSYQANQVKVELQQDLRRSMEWMIEDLRQTGSTGIQSIGVGGTSITFKIPSGVSGGKLQWDANVIEFNLGGADGDQLRRVYNGTTKILAQNFESIVFTQNDDHIDVNMDAAKTTNKGKVVSYDLDFTVQMRN